VAWYYALALILGVFAILAALGLPVAFAFLAAVLGASVLLIDPLLGPELVLSHVFESLAHSSLVPLPLFILLGEVIFHSGLARRAVDSFSQLLGRVPARESYLALGSGGLFSMLTGSTMANAALLGSTLAPQMREKGYNKQLTYGPILAAGGLAMIIPPSNIAVIYGTYAGVPVGPLLIAGLVPGLLLLMFYGTAIPVLMRLTTDKPPTAVITPGSLLPRARAAAVDLVPLIVIIFVVTGLIVLGIATPTESAALGASAAVVVALLYRDLTWAGFRSALAGTVRLTGMIFLILAAAVGFSRLLAFSGVTSAVTRVVAGLDVSPWVVLWLLVGIVIIMGTLIEAVPIIMICAPIFVPIVAEMGWNPLWFGMLILLALQVGMTTPPFGMLLFVLKGVAGRDATMTDMYKSAAPFLICDATLILLVYFFPSIVTWLPSIVAR
jgi:tripartite ATP-independent transporter DctM subunit